MLIKRVEVSESGRVKYSEFGNHELLPYTARCAVPSGFITMSWRKKMWLMPV